MPEKQGRAGRRRGLPGHGPLDPHWTTSRDPMSSKPGFPRPLNPSYVRETAALVRRDSCSKREATGIAAAAAVTISSGRQQAAAAAAADARQAGTRRLAAAAAVVGGRARAARAPPARARPPSSRPRSARSRTPEVEILARRRRAARSDTCSGCRRPRAPSPPNRRRICLQSSSSFITPTGSNIHRESKKQDTKLLAITSLIISDFQNFFTSRLCNKFATNSCLNSPPRFKHVATLPCKI